MCLDCLLKHVQTHTHKHTQEQMGEVLQGFLSTVCTLTRLYGDENVVEAVMQEQGVEIETSTELQELIMNEDFDALVRVCVCAWLIHYALMCVVITCTHVHTLSKCLLSQAEQVQNSLMDAFDVAEDNKEDYFTYREMLLDDRNLDIDNLGPAFKAKVCVALIACLLA